MIRYATLEDIDELLRMGKDFFTFSGYSEDMEFDEESTYNTCYSLIEKGGLLIGDGGILGFVVTPFFMSKKKVCQELFWWVDPEKRDTGVGLELLRVAQDIAREQGADIFSMTCLESNKGVSKIYESLGFVQRERTYMKHLEPMGDFEYGGS